MKVIYVKWHNNYHFVLGREYDTLPYKKVAVNRWAIILRRML